MLAIAPRPSVDASTRVCLTSEKSPREPILHPASFPKLKYHQLDKDSNEFRILTIYNDGDQDSPVRCHLNKYSLSSPPEYYALSYVWGDSKTTKEIIVNDVPFKATANLEHALRALRRRMTDEPDSKSFQFDDQELTDVKRSGNWQLQLHGSQEIHIWVDAVCINQSNPTERDAQVLRMHDIYTQSAATIAWLGLSSDDSGVAFSLLRILDTKSPEDLYEAVLLMDESNQYKRAWMAIANLLNRDYWNRIWTLQEVVLAKKVWFLAGPDSITAYSMMDALYGAKFRAETALSRHGYPAGHSTKDPCNFLKLCMKLWMKRVRTDCDNKDHNVHEMKIPGKFHIGTVNHKIPLVHLLLEKSHSRFQSSEILDQVYGLMSLGTDSATLIPNPSYQISLRDVMYGIYRTLAERSQRLEWMLLSCGNQPFQISPPAMKTTHDSQIESIMDYERRTRHYNIIQAEREEGHWPSWLPDHCKGSQSWSVMPFVEYGFHNDAETLQFNATRNRQPDIVFNGPVLQCYGLIFDTITASQYDSDYTVNYSKRTQRESFPLTSCPYADPAEVYKAIWHAISLPRINPLPEFHLADKAWAFAEFWNDIWQHGKSDPRESMYMPLPPTDSESLDALSVSRRWGLIHDQRDMLIHGLPLREWVRRRTLDWSISEDRITSGMGNEAGVEEFLNIIDEEHRERPHIESLFLLCSLLSMSIPNSSISKMKELEELKTCIRVMPSSNELFVTEKGYIGSRFKYYNKGESQDKVALLFGCSEPVLLRPRKNTDGYEFIGVCYVDGIEKGQGVEKLDESKVEWIDIY